MRIFVTGASGFVGGAIARTLHAGHEIRAMARSEASERAVRALGVEPVRCALGSVEPAHLAGCQAVVHCAAFVEEWGTREQFWQANVEGTAQLLGVAARAGVRRFIHIGTEAALFRGQDMRDIDESYPYPASTPFPYSESKAEAERRVLAANAPERDFLTLSIRPRLVWGPGDQTVLPALMRMVDERRFMWLDGGRARTSTTHIANLAHAIALALEHGRGGEAYFVTDGEDTTFREFLTALLRTQAVSAPDRSIPGVVARGLAATVEGTWRLLGLTTQPPITRFTAAITSRECTIRIDKARRELGYAPVVSVAEGLATMPRL